MSFFRKIVPEPIILWYHFLLSILGSILYGRPSKKMIIIGVVGTKGKTSTINFIWSVLNAGGYKTGIVTTANVKIGDKEVINSAHRTMPGRFEMQKFLRTMADSGCSHCIIEPTSEGIKQHRHRGIDFDILVFTNLSPEHLASHGGSFENYKKTKGKIFARLHKIKHKVFKCRRIDKVTIINADDDHANYYLSFKADKKISYGKSESANYRAHNITEGKNGVKFETKGSKFSLQTLGTFNVYNALPAIVIGKIFNVPTNLIGRGLASLSTIPGRMQRIDEGQPFTVIVDYAHEGKSMYESINACRKLAGKNRVLVLLGSEGGGRDIEKREAMGTVAGRDANVVVASTTDPYDDDPKEILDMIAGASKKEGKRDGTDLFVIVDRRQGIRKILSLAGIGDVVLITGMGSQLTMIVEKGKVLPWDEIKIVKEELQKLLKKK
ncbi:MAG: hypothetical protein COV70_04350 [Parcubacteria group bacterium CG11_big_fil_rev_8_21_14_0_20_39_22]|nr:MAG: hypothetical protein COV70_04350 [Parcubacteria group bacterium CG11_big_fil_rev_8_21_14_0_20_39_22]